MSSGTRIIDFEEALEFAERGEPLPPGSRLVVSAECIDRLVKAAVAVGQAKLARSTGEFYAYRVDAQDGDKPPDGNITRPAAKKPATGLKTPLNETPAAQPGQEFDLT